MIDRGKCNVLGVLIDAVDYEAAVEKIIVAGHERQPLAVSALAVHGVMTGVRDEIHRYRLNNLELVVPDGQPVRWSLNLLHHTSLPDRVYGPTLMLKVCERAASEGLPIFLYGSRQEVMSKLTANLKNKFPQLEITGTQPSLFRRTTPEEKTQIADKICRSGARITFVGLGCPRQEVWAYEYRGILSMPTIAVGAAFDFHAGLLAQAPSVLQKTGLEWFFRLIKEPRRLWRRYAVLNPLFLYLLTLQALKLKQFDPSNSAKPSHELLFG